MGACEILGFDPLYVANEGKLLAFVAPTAADKVLAAMRAHPLGKKCCYNRRGCCRSSRYCDYENTHRRFACGGHAFRRTTAKNMLRTQSSLSTAEYEIRTIIIVD